MKKPYYNLEVWGGIECTINRINDFYNDQLDYSGHYSRTDDLEYIADLGIKKIRYPLLWERHQPKKNTEIDWSFSEKQLLFFRENKIDVIAGLVHHGSGPVFTDLLDDQFPFLLAEYAKKVAQKFPWIKYYTPVNEPLTTARFSGLYGIWYPHHHNGASFLKMLLNQVKGIVLSMKAIREINPDAELIQTEDLGKTYSTPNLKYQADYENERRWLTYDLLCGLVNKKHPLWEEFRKHNLTDDLNFLHENSCTPNIFGYNHYLTSERFLDDRVHLYPKHTIGGNDIHQYVDVEAVRVDVKEAIGLENLLKEAWERYRQPMAITEVHLHCHREDQLRWFKKVSHICSKLRNENIDIKAVTAWAMLGSFGWNKLLTERGGEYEPGVFDVRNGNLRPTALAHFIKGVNHSEHILKLSEEAGWWQRDNRYHHLSSSINAHTIPARKLIAPILIIGKNGTLGKAFAQVCEDRHFNFIVVGRQECNIRDYASIENAIIKYKPWAIINAAGYVRVDDAEADYKNCMDDNVFGAHQLSIAAKKYGIKMVTFSTDLVFDGEKNSAYLEDDATNPLNVYGQSKAEAEKLILQEDASVLIIRTSAFFGPWDEHNFVHYVRKNLIESETIEVAKDVIISPTYVPDLVNATLDLLIDNESGIWHLTNDGEISWADLACEIADRHNLNRKFIHTVANADLKLPAKRPLFSALSSQRGIHLPSLENALRRYSVDEVWFSRRKITTRRA